MDKLLLFDDFDRIISIFEVSEMSDLIKYAVGIIVNFTFSP